MGPPAGNPSTSNTDQENIVQQLLDGFWNLRKEHVILREQYARLEAKLDTAKQQYREFANQFLPPADATRRINQALTAISEVQPQGAGDWLEEALKCGHEDRVERASKIREAEDASQRFWNRPRASTTKRHSSASRGPSPTCPTINEHPFEQDFTTSGTPGKLGCPFSSLAEKTPEEMVGPRFRKAQPPTPRSSTSRPSRHTPVHGRKSRRSTFHDPITAEICGMDHGVTPASSVAASVAGSGSGPKCPIRFLDQHPPEEIAEYFEKHKHEIPRSHEVCVKRWQTNAESVRRLDERYGNLVSMIQGLGTKHQAMLPETPNDEEEVEDGAEVMDKAKVRSWAAQVSPEIGEEDTNAEEGEEERGRQQQFEKPLKEVRLGESPSRPWGIQIPSKYDMAKEDEDAKSEPKVADPSAHPIAIGKNHAPEEDPLLLGSKNEVKERKCPFSHMAGMLPNPHVETPDAPEPLIGKTTLGEAMAVSPIHPDDNSPRFKGESQKRNGNAQSTITFNGPVFFGYPPEQATQFLKQLGALQSRAHAGG